MSGVAGKLNLECAPTMYYKETPTCTYMYTASSGSSWSSQFGSLKGKQAMKQFTGTTYCTHLSFKNMYMYILGLVFGVIGGFITPAFSFILS